VWALTPARTAADRPAFSNGIIVLSRLRDPLPCAAGSFSRPPGADSSGAVPRSRLCHGHRSVNDVVRAVFGSCVDSVAAGCAPETPPYRTRAGMIRHWTQSEDDHGRRRAPPDDALPHHQRDRRRLHRGVLAIVLTTKFAKGA